MNNLSVICTGGTGGEPVELTLWLNGQRVGQVADSDEGIVSGGVGLFASSLSGSTDIVFDNFAVLKA